SFAHPESLKTKNTPGFKDGETVLKKTITDKIEQLKITCEVINKKIAELDRLILKSGQSDKAKRPGRLIVRDNEKLRLEKINQTIAQLEKSLELPKLFGKQEVRGGGEITTDDNGKIIKINAKIGDYLLSEKEIKKTLYALKKQGVNLEAIELTMYDQSGRAIIHKNANQYLALLAPKPTLSQQHNQASVAALVRSGGFIAERTRPSTTSSTTNPLHPEDERERSRKS
ncbi:MAG TPA: hypothetical protein VJL60_05210, partial [Gammaproteobacteria bacterium]|nr:hypothetical protein [Gammaproteobacteria bacterium]